MGLVETHDRPTTVDGTYDRKESRATELLKRQFGGRHFLHRKEGGVLGSAHYILRSRFSCSSLLHRLAHNISFLAGADLSSKPPQHVAQRYPRVRSSNAPGDQHVNQQPVAQPFANMRAPRPEPHSFCILLELEGNMAGDKHSNNHYTRTMALAGPVDRNALMPSVLFAMANLVEMLDSLLTILFPPELPERDLCQNRSALTF